MKSFTTTPSTMPNLIALLVPTTTAARPTPTTASTMPQWRRDLHELWMPAWRVELAEMLAETPPL